MSTLHFFVVASITWACPGGLLSGLVPAAAKPLVCQAKRVDEPFSSQDLAMARIRELGPGNATLYEYRGLRKRELPITWAPETDD